MSATPESTLANPGQIIADLERQLAEREAELAERTAERDEALQRETAAAEVLGVINSSPGDLTPVFEAILDKAHSLCGVEYGALFLINGEQFRAVAVRGYPEKLEQLVRRPYSPEPNSPVRALLHGEALVEIPDVIAHQAEAPNPRAEVAIATGIHRVLFVPLRRDDQLLGMITAARKEASPFAAKEIALLQNFAAQAVIAIENARLITETRDALEQQTATAEVLQVINSSPGDLAPVFDAMLEKAMRLCEADVGNFWTYDGEAFTAVAMRDPRPEHFEWARQRRRGGPGSISDSLIRGESVIHIPDAADTDAYRAGEPARRAIVDLNGGRTLLAVALRKGDELLGYINIFRRVVRPFSDKQIALLQNFAAQAVIAMENARLINETREALEQQTATAEVLQVINSSPGNLRAVFDAMLEKAMALCGIAHGSLQTYDGEQFRAVAVRGHPEPLAALLRQGYRLTAGHPMQALVDGARFVQISDLTRVAPELGVAVRTAVDAGSRTLLCIPLRRDETLLGQITAVRREVRPFSEKEIALLENFAAQAVIAMENARLITETREALQQQTATAEVLQVINSSPGDLAPVFDAMLEKAMHLCEAAFGTLTTFDGDRFHTAATRGVPAAFAEFRKHHPPPPSGSGSARILRTKRPVHILDLMAEEDYQTGDPSRRAIVDLGGARTALAVPLLKDEAVLGFIMIYRQEVQLFSDKQIALLQNFAAQAVIAMENARLLTETREALEQQTATAEVLQVINSSPGDLTPVFDAILEQATRLCEAPFGILRTWDGESLHFGAVRGDPQFSEWVRQRGPVRPDSDRSPLARILAGERVVSFADAPRDEGYRTSAGWREMVEASGVRSAIWVALHKDDALLGYITVYRQEVRPFTDKQIALLQNFAAQAVIAMENARLLTETREALEQQTATAEVLQVINSSPGDLTPVFDAMLEKAMRLCEVAYGNLWTYDGERFHPVAMHGDPRFTEWVRQRGPVPPASGTILERIVRGERFVHIADVASDEVHTGAYSREAGEVSGARTLLVVPLQKDSALLGAMFAYRQEVRPFSDKQIALFQNFAAQAVIAMENARLLTETREALEQQTATAEVLQVINSSPGDLAPVFDAMLEKAMRLCEADYGHVLTFDGQQFHPTAIRGEAGFVEWRRRLGPVRPDSGADASPLGRVMHGERVAQVADATQEKAYRTHSGYKELVDTSGIRSQAAVALRKEDALLGAIVVYRREVRQFSDKQIALLQNFAAQAVIAMENARLVGELRQRTDEVAELNRGLEARVAEQVEELGRVGRLKRFLAPQLAELIVSQGDERILESHRREIVVVFCDLRGYTAFTETAEPEEVLDFLREYHGALGPLVSQYEGTLDQFSGDGIMVFFNDPVPIPDPAERAVKMALAMREAAGALIAIWRRRDRQLGFGAGIAQGYATLGQIGFAERSGYTAIGTVCNLATRLCVEAKDGQILISGRVAAAVEKAVPLEDLGNLALKGLNQPVSAFNVPLAPGQPAFRVIEGGPLSV